MTHTIEINTDIQPVDNRTQSEISLNSFGISLSELPFDTLQVGHSFTITLDKEKYWRSIINTLSAVARKYGKNTNKRFKCRQVGGKLHVVSCMRIA